MNQEIQDGWNVQERFKRLKIKAPPFWNDYDRYLLEGGKEEYEDWLKRNHPAVSLERTID